MTKTADTVDPRTLVPLPPLEFRVLLVLVDGELHGYGLAKAIEARDATLGRIYPTNLYRRLRDMAGRGLIEEHAPRAGDDGRRRMFSLTALGRRVARQEARRLEDLVGDARQKALLSSRSADG